MKEFSTKIKNQLKKFIPFRKLNPHIYWNNLLYIFFILILVLIAFSFYMLFKIKNQQIFQVTSVSTEVPSLINEKLLKKVNESFESKQIKETEIQSGVNSYKDPSIN